jgi:hypothetical protein
VIPAHTVPYEIVFLQDDVKVIDEDALFDLTVLASIFSMIMGFCHHFVGHAHKPCMKIQRDTGHVHSSNSTNQQIILKFDEPLQHTVSGGNSSTGQTGLPQFSQEVLTLHLEFNFPLAEGLDGLYETRYSGTIPKVALQVGGEFFQQPCLMRTHVQLGSP